MTSVDERARCLGTGGADREAWATARRRIERSRYCVGVDGQRRRWRTRLLHVSTGLFALGLRSIGQYTCWRRNALAPELVEFELALPNLPTAFDGYRILHVSDTHFDTLPELAMIARDLLAGVKVDLLALTGDVLGRHHAPLSSAVDPLALALSQVEVGDTRLAVLGNHDPTEMAEGLEAIGFRVLINESLMLERERAHIVVTGLDDVHSFYTKAAYDALMSDVAEFRISLVHSPEIADHAAKAGVALYLCGHTHGGQICLPGGRPLLTGLTRCKHAACGLWNEGAMLGYTSRGLGSSWPPLRKNCHPELTVITLRCTA